MTVARVAHYSPYAVAEFAWTLAMALNRRIVRAAGRTRDFDFRLDGLLGRDFHGRTVGVIGTGRIGTAFAAIARGFGMRLLGWDITPNPDCAELGMEYVELDRLFREADLISLHVPLMPSTHHLLGARRLALNEGRRPAGQHQPRRPDRLGRAGRDAARGPARRGRPGRVRGGGGGLLLRQVAGGDERTKPSPGC